MNGHGPIGAAPRRRTRSRRLIVTVAAIVVCASAATTAVFLHAGRQEQRRTLAHDLMIYDTLLGFAATHARWDGVEGLVADLGRRTGRRITLLTEDRRLLAGPGTSAGASPFTVVDPLQVEPALASTEQAPHGIDRRAVGPFRITPEERRSLQPFVDEQLSCLATDGLNATVEETPNGRPYVRVATKTGQASADACRPSAMPETVGSEDNALRTLNDLVLTCIDWQRPRELVLTSPTDINLEALDPDSDSTTLEADDGTAQRIEACLPTTRRTQLRGWVAPPALLFVDAPGAGPAVAGVAVPWSNALPLAQLIAVLLAAVVVTALLVGGRLPRRRTWLPPAELPEPVGARRVPIIDHDEIGTLAKSFNALADQHSNLDRQRKVMVNDIAHELRNPLSNIRSWLEAAQDGIQSADRQFVDLLLEEAVILQRVIDDMRDLAAADAGNLRVAPERVYVNDLLIQVVTAHRSAAETAQVALTVDSLVDPEWNVDPTRLRQAVGNLVSNAVRHTPAGGSVTVRLTVIDAHLVIEVADTGVGIAAEDLPRLFDRFWRADASRSQWSGGSGLGLAIARRLVEAHGGDISVTSEVGVGTTFTVRLPS